MDYLNIRKDLEVNRDFKNQNNSKYRLANEYLEVSLKLNSVFISSRSLGGSEVLMFQSLLDLCRQSLVMATLQRPSISYALLRQATEKYRDLKCILEQPDLGDLYMRGRNAAPKGIWRKTFRFSKDDDAILQLYNIASDWGVHSTISLFDEAASVETIGDENYVRLSKKKFSKDAFIHSTMGLQAFLLKLAIALMDRLDTGDSRSEDEYEAAKSVISEVSKRLIQLQPKLDKLIKLRTTK